MFSFVEKYNLRGISMSNKLYFGDNLTVLRGLQDSFVDLIYLDPPFNSKKNYNLLFRNEKGNRSDAQIRAFHDTWKWDLNAERTWTEIISNMGPSVVNLLSALRQNLGTNSILAYLVMMAPRLKELHRVLKPSGSLFLHCDSTSSHYLKLLMDAIFLPIHFRNEIIWCYRQGGRSDKYFPRKHDTIFFYTKSNNWTFNSDNVRIPYHGNGGYQTSGKGVVNQNGRTYHPNPDGKIPEDWWDIPAIPPMSKERIGYPTQKPIELLERIINACSDEGDIVLDPFCGCGTTIVAAEKLNRNWIGIDITHLAITLVKTRLEQYFGPRLSKYEIIGAPIDTDGAKQLASHDRYQFQWWALGLIGARPLDNNKRGPDGGVDGYIYFHNELQSSIVGKIVIQVKSGKVNPTTIRELATVRRQQNADISVLLTLEEPSSTMNREAANEGFLHCLYDGQLYPRLQTITIKQALDGKTVEFPKVIPY
jgi:site-specific DNA-methyltransferase (adenine-specific)